MGEMRILDGSGDTKVVWDPKNEDDTDMAETQFDQAMDKGYTAYAVKKDGSKGRKITKFDPQAGKIILVPRIAGG